MNQTEHKLLSTTYRAAGSFGYNQWLSVSFTAYALKIMLINADLIIISVLCPIYGQRFPSFSIGFQLASPLKMTRVLAASLFSVVGLRFRVRLGPQPTRHAAGVYNLVPFQLNCLPSYMHYLGAIVLCLVCCAP